MKKILSILMMFSTVALAAPTKATLNIMCDDTKTLFQYFIEGDYNEVPYWAGFEDTNKMSFVLLTNKETGTWTMIQYNAKKACVIAVGDRWKTAPDSEKPNL